MKRRILIFLFFIALTCSLFAQTDSSNDSLRHDALKVFFDCEHCDDSHIRREVSYVNYVRDRKQAQVYIMQTSRSTGAGGNEYNIELIGQQNFTNINDTLTYIYSVIIMLFVCIMVIRDIY